MLVVAGRDVGNADGVYVDGVVVVDGNAFGG